CVGLTPLRNVARGARTAAVEFGLDVLGRETQPRRASIDHAANGRTMRLTEGRDAEQGADSIAGHDETDVVAEIERRRSLAQASLGPAPSALVGLRAPGLAKLLVAQL